MSDDEEAPPPVLGKWRNVYIVLAVQLGLLVLGLYVLTRWAS